MKTTTVILRVPGGHCETDDRGAELLMRRFRANKAES
jgi:hypothetical protein